VNISSQLDYLQRRLDRIQIIQKPPTLELFTLQPGEAAPADLTPWHLLLHIEPKRA
jgi:hypothetical protein